MLCPPELNYISVFGFPIYYYGMCLALAIFAGVYTAHIVAVKKYALLNVIPTVSGYMIIGGIIGARLYYCMLNWEFYLKNPVEILAIREGGLSIHGAILGGVIVLYCYAKKHNFNFLQLCDILSVGLPLGQAIGRLGNFFNSEAFGLPTNLPWKMFISEGHRPLNYTNFSYFHPTFLYEIIFNLIIFLFLYYFILPRNKETFGLTAAFYLLFYSLIRIPVEFLRIDCNTYILGLPFPVLVSIVLICLSSVFIFSKKINR